MTSGLSAPQPLRRHLGLGPPDVGGREEDLPLEVGEVDHVVVDDTDTTHAGRREIVQHGRSETSGPYDQDGAAAQRVLPLLTDLLEHELAIVPPALRAR